MSDSFYYEDSKCPKCPRKDRARLADQTLGVSHVKDVTRFWKRGTRSWGPPPSGSLSLGLFQSFSETWNCNADDSFPFETDDDIIVEYSAVGSRDWRSEADVEHVSCFIIVHVELCKLGNCQVGLDLLRFIDVISQSGGALAPKWGSQSLDILPVFFCIAQTVP